MGGRDNTKQTSGAQQPYKRAYKNLFKESRSLFNKQMDNQNALQRQGADMIKSVAQWQAPYAQRNLQNMMQMGQGNFGRSGVRRNLGAVARGEYLQNPDDAFNNHLVRMQQDTASVQDDC